MPRIPYAVNVAWDAAERRPLLALSVAMAVLSMALFAWRPLFPVAGFVFLAGVYLSWAVARPRIREAAEERDEAVREAAALNHQLRRIWAGEAAAATTEIRPIGGHGERRS